jgi:hypothetical protein
MRLTSYRHLMRALRRQHHLLFGALLITLWASSVAADGPQYATSWEFTIEYWDANTTLRDSDPLKTGPVVMPAGGTWQCSRMAKQQTTHPANQWMASFACTNSTDNSKVSVGGYCPIAAVGSDKGSAYVESNRVGVRFSVRCETHVATRANP